MRQRRIERGALTFDSIEVEFQMDTETHDPLDIGIYPIRETDQMIEEFMLDCNFSVAEKILKPPAIFVAVKRFRLDRRDPADELLPKLVGSIRRMQNVNPTVRFRWIDELEGEVASNFTSDTGTGGPPEPLDGFQVARDIIPDVREPKAGEPRLWKPLGGARRGGGGTGEASPLGLAAAGQNRLSSLLKVLTKPLGKSAYHSKAMPERLLINWPNSRASDPPTLQQLARKWARCCLGFSTPVKILKDGGTKPFGPNEWVFLSKSWRGRWRVTLLHTPGPEDRRRYDFERTVERFHQSSLKLMVRRGWGARERSKNSLGTLGNDFEKLHQPAPTKEMFEPLHRMAAAVGLELDISSSKALIDSLDHIVGVDPDCKKLIKILATRCMIKAVYSWSGDMNPTEFHHYGLAAPLYTHFTSPMRRYANIIVHRLLAATLEISKLSENFLDSLRLTEIENNKNLQFPLFFYYYHLVTKLGLNVHSDLNYRQINAKMANRASIYLHKVIYFKKRFDIEGLNCLTSRGSRGEEWILDEAHQRLSKKGTYISYCALQMVMIHLERTEEKSLIVENVNGAFIYVIYHLLDEDDEDDVHMVPGNVDEAPRNANIAKACAGSTPTVSSRSFGRVIGIIKRNWSFFCGSLKPSSLSIENGGTPQALFISKDCRIPMICIQGGHLEKLLNKRIIVAVDSWDCSSRYPCGHHIRTIGEIGEREVENEVILIENDINSRAFPVQALACLPPHPWSLSSEDLANPHREDLRYLRVFSVDQPGCKDIDDALHCSLLPNGNFEVGVHIADVTNFVHPGTPLDKEAAQRGTSVYLVDKRIDMLPKLLTEDICSLRPGVERFSFSVILTMKPDAKIVSTRYTKSTIKSNAALSYVEAQARMDDSLMIDPLTTDLRNLNTLAKLMRQRRIERGALTFDSIEVKFQMDTETHDPLDIGVYQIREADQMIEEFMLACNFSVAEKILKHFPSCSLLRHQPAPTKEMFEPLHRMAAAFGLDLDISSSKALIDSLDHVVGLDPDCKKLFKILATRCMTKAVYSWSGDMNPTEFHHYGLAAPLYTHFTSPMRRYADIIVHRLLAAALEISKLPEIFLDSLRLTDIENNLNYRQINAKMANRASIYLHKVIYFKKRPMDIEARIIKIKPYGFVVFVPRFDIEGLICLTSKGSRGEEWILDEEHQRLSKKGTDISYCALQMVRIHLEVVEHRPYGPKFQLTLISTR
ncbi:hypothetical protein M5K25_000213 [Dendrobium thyrsiflorum]|uniref:Ribosomal RNA-processing protein 44 n=1 Tax=Dendrobium thyrsiflorum TaxID=117978 RepID=A0ABD0VUT2_DENTH